MSISAIIPAARAAALNARLEAEGFGPANFSVRLTTTTGSATTHLSLHCWDDPAFRTALERARADFPTLKIVDGDDGPAGFGRMVAAEARARADRNET